MKRLLLAITASIVMQPAQAIDYESVIDYRVGGAKPYVRPAASIPWNPNMNFGFGWGGGGECGAFDLDTSIINSFDDGQVKRMQSVVIARLRSAFNPSAMAGAVLKRANPDLYEFLSNGIMQGTASFDEAIKSCEHYQDMFLDSMPSGAYEKMAVGDELRNYVRQAKEEAESIDIVKKMKTLGSGDAGTVVYIKANGREVKKGGAGQEALKPVKEATECGYKVMLDRDCESESFVTSTMRETHPIAKEFESPTAIYNYTAEIVGETVMRSCDGCKRMESQAPKGIRPIIQRRVESLEGDYSIVFNKPIEMVNDADIEKISAGGAIHINRDIVKAIKSMPVGLQNQYINSLVSEVAFAKEVERMLLARRALITGLGETELKDNTVTKADLENKLRLLNQELDLIEQEMRIKRQISGVTVSNILERAMVMDAKRSGIKANRPVMTQGVSE